MSAPTTFSLNEVYAALGIRSSRAVPSMAVGAVLPVVTVGSINGFSPEPVEARGLFAWIDVYGDATGWSGVFMQSLAEGGTIIEAIRLDFSGAGGNYPTWEIAIAPERPWFGGDYPLTSRVIPIGGQQIRNLWSWIEHAAYPDPDPYALGGSGIVALPQTSSVTTWFGEGVLDNLWVPPGWYFWMIASTQGQAGNPRFRPWVRWREIPAQQGPA